MSTALESISIEELEDVQRLVLNQMKFLGSENGGEGGSQDSQAQPQCLGVLRLLGTVGSRASQAEPGVTGPGPLFLSCLSPARYLALLARD